VVAVYSAGVVYAMSCPAFAGGGVLLSAVWWGVVSVLPLSAL
jgi:hypothetical protein